mmetsp:Transcript_24953/g.59513  ORF Transcript_24953/g.59513 Transcript_24953/m.59513 type:complete len:537 (-) Transcript_24953:197-1807(-)
MAHVRVLARLQSRAALLLHADAALEAFGDLPLHLPRKLRASQMLWEQHGGWRVRGRQRVDALLHPREHFQRLDLIKQIPRSARGRALLRDAAHTRALRTVPPPAPPARLRLLQISHLLLGLLAHQRGVVQPHERADRALAQLLVVLLRMDRQAPGAARTRHARGRVGRVALIVDARPGVAALLQHELHEHVVAPHPLQADQREQREHDSDARDASVRHVQHRHVGEAPRIAPRRRGGGGRGGRGARIVVCCVVFSRVRHYFGFVAGEHRARGQLPTFSERDERILLNAGKRIPQEALLALTRGVCWVAGPAHVDALRIAALARDVARGRACHVLVTPRVDLDRDIGLRPELEEIVVVVHTCVCLPVLNVDLSDSPEPPLVVVLEPELGPDHAPRVPPARLQVLLDCCVRADSVRFTRQGRRGQQNLRSLEPRPLVRDVKKHVHPLLLRPHIHFDGAQEHPRDGGRRSVRKEARRRPRAPRLGAAPVYAVRLIPTLRAGFARLLVPRVAEVVSIAGAVAFAHCGAPPAPLAVLRETG